MTLTMDLLCFSNTLIKDRATQAALVLGGLIACASWACSTAPESLPNHEPPSPASVSPPNAQENTLEDAVEAQDEALRLTLERVNYALLGVDKLKARWPWLSADDTCVVITALDAQYLLGCSPPEGSPYTLSQARFRGQPVYENKSGQAVLGPQAAPYRAFAGALVGTMILYHPAQEALTGFAKERPWFFVTALEALVEAHPGFDDTTRTEEWLAIFVHEYFHTRQFLQPSAYLAWGSILTKEINPASLVALYMEDEAYKAAVDAEFELLSEAVAAQPDAQQARATLKRWLEMRQRRIEAAAEAYVGGNLERDDMTYTYIEGVARYVENTYLVDPELHPSGKLKADPRFDAFKDSEGKGYQGMWQRGMPGGQYYYGLGMHVGLLLDAIDPSWTHKVHEHPRWVVGVAQDVVAGP